MTIQKQGVSMGGLESGEEGVEGRIIRIVEGGQTRFEILQSELARVDPARARGG